VRADHVLSRELKLPQEELATRQWQRPAHSADRLVESEVKRTIGRPPARFVSALVRGAAVSCVALSVVTLVLGVSDAGLLIDSAHAQSKQQNPLEKARTAVETLLNRLRGRDMPEGIVKANGRLEATEVDVSAKYAGRLATLTANEGDEVTAGQVVATISSPETEAELLAAQAQVVKAKRALAEAVALIAQRKSDLDFTRADYERGRYLLERGHVSQQVADLRRNKFEAAEAAYVAANAQRDQADAAIKTVEADVQRR
jgi:HlyD family secretion protein